MAIKKVALLIPFLISANAWAGTMEHCPKIADIKEVATASYIAPTVSGKGQWYGTSQSGRGLVGGFEEAIFKAHGDAVEGAVVGELLHCGYALRDGGKLDLRFKQEGTVVSIQSGGVWEQWYSQYYCEDKTEGACIFKELKRPSKG
ncbi:hypothetical protein C1886_08580 [Pseudomonas sp. FW300-N1A1]|uniref:DUF3757 domain-containing protein n=1 Tax=Pseudomonas sp. FW300-N1A1 TaxID=2075555 RepID=UPI000CD089E3|nr:DUF3757 domain-containing protein [Pseudomonas sp. FW300-N1A1]POA20448.1 hypothetical protein C1886_08580 [Pseudomonas sp. FW300-N1A1]